MCGCVSKLFLAVQNSPIGDLVPWSIVLSDSTNNQSLHNTTEWPQRLVTFELFDQSDEETRPDQKTYLPIYLEGTAQITARNCQEPPDNRQEPGTFIFDKQRATLKAKKTCDFWDRWSKWWGNMTWPTIWQYLTMLIIVDNFYSCWYNYDNYWTFLKNFTTKSQQHEQRQWQRQSWDNSDNWETEFMTIFVAWQLRVTLDSIRNSCDVFVWCLP